MKTHIRRYGFGQYLAGALLTRLSDEMDGQTLLLLSLAVTHRVTLGADVLAALTASAAIGGPLWGALLDRAPQPGRVLAGALGAYAVGFGILATTLGHISVWQSVMVAVAVGSLTSTISSGWSSRLPDLVSASQIDRASAVDAASYNVAGLVGPAGAGLLVMVWGGIPVAILLSGFILAAVPAAWRMPAVPAKHHQVSGFLSDVWPGLRTIASSRALRRVTVVSVVSYFGFGMIGVVAPLTAQGTFGRAGFGGPLLSVLSAAALLATAIYAKYSRVAPPEVVVGATPFIMALGFVLLMTSSRGLAVAAMALLGIADGPQLAAVFAVRHREAEDTTRSQVFMTGASLKIAAASLGMALAGHLGASSLRIVLVVALAAELGAEVAYFALP